MAPEPTDFVEEQENEIVVLRSVYDSEFEMISESPFKFQIFIKYQDLGDPVLSDPPNLVLQFEYTEKYPDELPLFEIVKSEHLPEEIIKEINTALIKSAKQNVGTVLAYNLIAVTQEVINTYGDSLKKGTQPQDANNESLTKDEESECKKCDIVHVTKETFEEWKKKFDLEMGIGKINVEDAERRLTGRELFQKDTSLNVSDLKFIEEADLSFQITEPMFNDDHVAHTDESLFSDESPTPDDMPPVND